MKSAKQYNQFESNCSCYENSRFDPDGNLVLLVTCKACLAGALENIQNAVCNSASGVVQLELFEGYGAKDKPSAILLSRKADL